MNHKSTSPCIPYWDTPEVNDDENGSWLHQQGNGYVVLLIIFKTSESIIILDHHGSPIGIWPVVNDEDNGSLLHQ